ncbi:MAG: GNAT family N-acetyltransferase [Alphaproteobacteria bacterium]|nr:GNAT family N-acetyltransferase [Alphaproteobacteria bacterium]
MEWQRGGFSISTDMDRLDMAFTVDYLAQTYWGEGTAKAKIRQSIENALNFGLYQDDGQQVGFTRVVTDYARFAWLSDVFVIDDLRGRDLGKWLVECAVNHPDLKGMSRFLLATADAHGLYQQFGFEALAKPENFMLKT